MSFLSLVFVLGFAAAGAVAVVRAVVQELRPLWLLAKPLSCDLCMSWWASVGLVLFALAVGHASPVDAGLAVLASTGVCLPLVRGSNRLSE